MSWNQEQLTALRRLLRLKQVRRKGWTRHRIPFAEVESVADHSYGVALLCLLMCPPELDRTKVLELALMHDLAEVETGDITPDDGVLEAEKKQRERGALRELLRDLPNSSHHLHTLAEYQQGTTPEARWVKSIDKLEMTLQSLNYEADYKVGLGEFRDSSERALESLGLAEIFSREKSGPSLDP